MKRNSTITLLLYAFLGLFLSFGNLNAQTAWLQDGQQWGYRITGGWTPPPVGIHNLTVAGDTIIAGIECKKLSLLNRFEFAYEAESAIYKYDIFEDNFFKIYDFSLSVGDSILLKYGKKYKIDDVGVMDVNGIDFRFQHISFFGVSDAGNYWEHGPYLVLEGIGFVGNVNEGEGIPCSFFFVDYIPCSSALDGQDSFFQCFRDGDFTYDPENLCMTVATKEVEVSNFELYPNPTTDFFTIVSSDKQAPVLVTMYDVLGRQVWEGVPQNGRVDVQSFQRQAYIVKVMSQNGGISIEKIMIK